MHVPTPHPIGIDRAERLPHWIILVAVEVAAMPIALEEVLSDQTVDGAHDRPPVYL
jgi:hypothetical protein